MKEIVLVFDYWKDMTAESGNLPRFLSEIDKTKKVYVFVSHHHKDHFSQEIFNWVNLFEDVQYILSKDTSRHCRHILREESLYKGPKLKAHQFHVLTPGEIYEDNLIKVAAFDSTDIGNSYVVTAEGQNIFHAGDLNAWLWADESTEKEVEDALNAYKGIVKEIASYQSALDIAMFPVDSRIGRGYYTGVKLLLEEIDVKRFFPMHFCLGEEKEQKIYEEDALKFDLYANPERGEYIGLRRPYDKYAYAVKDD